MFVDNNQLRLNNGLHVDLEPNSRLDKDLSYTCMCYKFKLAIFLNHFRVCERPPTAWVYCYLKLHVVLSTMSRQRKTGQLVQSNAKLRVLLDLDQVLADFEGYFLTKYREKYPDLPFIPSEERTGFFIRDQYAKLGPELPDKVREIYDTEGFFYELPEVEGGVAAAKELAQMEDVDVFICTSPLTFYRHCLHEKFQWVEEHLGEEWLHRIIISKDKTIVNAHILIDDRPDVTGVMKPPSWEQIVFTANHNKRTNIHGKRRLDNWTDGKWRELIEDFKKRI